MRRTSAIRELTFLFVFGGVTSLFRQNNPPPKNMSSRLTDARRIRVQLEGQSKFREDFGLRWCRPFERIRFGLNEAVSDRQAIATTQRGRRQKSRLVGRRVETGSFANSGNCPQNNSLRVYSQNSGKIIYSNRTRGGSLSVRGGAGRTPFTNLTRLITPIQNELP